MFSSLRTPLEKKIVLSSIASLHYFKGFSPMRTCSVYETAELLINMGNKIDRNFMNGVLPSYLMTNDEAASEVSYSGFVKKVKKENINSDNIGEIMLCQIPV